MLPLTIVSTRLFCLLEQHTDALHDLLVPKAELMNHRKWWKHHRESASLTEPFVRKGTARIPLPVLPILTTPDDAEVALAAEAENDIPIVIAPAAAADEISHEDSDEADAGAAGDGAAGAASDDDGAVDPELDAITGAPIQHDPVFELVEPLPGTSPAAAKAQYDNFHRRVMDLTQLIKRFSTGTMTAARKRTTLGDATLALANRRSLAKRRLRLTVWEWRCDDGACACSLRVLAACTLPPSPFMHPALFAIAVLCSLCARARASCSARWFDSLPRLTPCCRSV